MTRLLVADRARLVSSFTQFTRTSRGVTHAARGLALAVLAFTVVASEGRAQESTPAPVSSTADPAADVPAVDAPSADKAPADKAATEAPTTDVPTAEPATETPAPDAGAVPAPTALVVAIDATVPCDVFALEQELGPTPLSGDRAVTFPPGAHLVALRERTTGRTHGLLVTVVPAALPGSLVLDVDTGLITAEGTVGATVIGTTGPAVASASPVVDEGESACPENTPCVSKGGIALWPRFRLRTGYELQQPDANVPFIGQNDGFLLDQARLGFSGAYRDLVAFTLTVDAASFLPGAGANDPRRRLVAAVVDAFVQVKPSRFFNVWVGQTFMPADQEGSTTRGVFNFTDRSVASGGVRPGRGFVVDGMSDGREIGVVFGAQDVDIGPVLLDYRIAVANGAGGARYGNDNKLPALYSRFAIGYERYATLGFGGHFNPKTTGDLPALYNETETQGFVDFRVDAFGIDFLAQVQARQVTFDSLYPDLADPNRSAFGLGATSWLVLKDPFGLPLFGVKPGYRISYYDPTTALTDDALLEHSLGIRFDPPGLRLPLALLVDVTSLWELDSTGIKSFDTNRLTAILQLNF
jgi:hypothetical protein